jgi:hypothetical protein
MTSTQCAQCGHEIAPDGLNRLPPWCPQCGRDLKAATLHAPGDTTTASPSPPGQAAVLHEPRPPAALESLHDAIERINLSHRDAHAQARSNRLFGLQIFLVGVLLLAATVALAWLYLELSGGRRILVAVGLGGLGLILTACGIYAMVSGENLIDLRREE